MRRPRLCSARDGLANDVGLLSRGVSRPEGVFLAIFHRRYRIWRWSTPCSGFPVACCSAAADRERAAAARAHHALDRLSRLRPSPAAPGSAAALRRRARLRPCLSAGLACFAARARHSRCAPIRSHQVAQLGFSKVRAEHRAEVGQLPRHPPKSCDRACHRRAASGADGFRQGRDSGSVAARSIASNPCMGKSPPGKGVLPVQPSASPAATGRYGANCASAASARRR